MRKYGKWALTLGLAVATPSLGLTAPWSRADSADQPAEKAPAKPAAKTSNQKMADEIALALHKARMQGFDIEIEYKDGTAILKGRVLDIKQKDKATQVVEKLPGVKNVDNRLVLAPRPSPTQRMAGSVQQASHTDGEPASRVQQAAHVGGPPSDRVQQVNHESASPNQAVADEIAATLSGAGLLNGCDMEIKCQNGMALLSGTVQTGAQRQAIERVASQVPGVMAVNNQLIPTREAPRGPMGPGGQMMAQGPMMGPNGQMMGPGGPMRGPNGPMMGPGGQMMGPGGPMMGPNGMSVNPAAFQQGMPGGQVPLPTGIPAAPVAYGNGGPGAASPVYNMPALPEYAWPSYAQYPNSAAVNYPSQYSASAWPYIGPFYPYPQVPLGWRDATLRWDDGFWNLQFRQRTDRWWWFLSPKNW